MMSDNYKIVVFDLDETLGYFQELSFFIDAIENVRNIKITKQEFYNILDNYPEFLRPNILNILNLIKRKKIRNSNIKVMIYTNNQNPKKWVLDIKDYFNHKLNYELFDKVVLSSKYEPKRKFVSKSLDDFWECTGYPKSSKVLFIDDQYHPMMIKNNVTYLHVKPYSFKEPEDISNWLIGHVNKFLS